MRFDCICVCYRKEFETLTPDYKALEEADMTGNILEVILTLKGSAETIDKKGKTYDFVSRNFSPWVGIPEDPVTGKDKYLKPYSLEVYFF